MARKAKRMAGYLELERANLRWFLSIENADLPAESRKQQRSTYRWLAIDGDDLDFTDGFTDLHTRSYEEIVGGRGFGLEEARPSIEITAAFRNAKIDLSAGERHPKVAGLM